MKLYKKYFNSTANINIADKDFKKKFIENIAQEYKKQIKLATEKSQNYLTKEKIYLKCKLPTLKNAEPTIRCLTNITTAMSSYIIFFLEHC